MTYRLVLDCGVFLQAIISKKSDSFRLLEQCEEGNVALLMSDDVYFEILDVLGRPFIRDKFKMITDERIEQFFLKLRLISIYIENVPKVISYSRDPKDERYLNLAKAGKASHLISFDKDLLDIEKEYDAETININKKLLPNTRILSPSDFVDILREG